MPGAATAAGSDLAVTRWREDGTCDNWGTFCYIRDVASGNFWSNRHQPTLKRPDNYEAIFSEGRAEFRRRDAVGTGDDQIETYTEIVVSPEDDIELRRSPHQSLAPAPGNRGDQLRRGGDCATGRRRAASGFQQSVCADRDPARAARHLVHPAAAFAGEQAPWMLHLMVVHGAETGAVSYETDRLRFIGRTRTTAAPLAMIDSAALSGSEGSVLDPIVAIRYRITLEPQQSVTIDMVSALPITRDMAVCLIDKYQDRHLADRVFDLAWTHSQVVLRQLNASEADAQLYARLASSVIYANARCAPMPACWSRTAAGSPGCGATPSPAICRLCCCRLGCGQYRSRAPAGSGARLLALKGLAVDLVIWNEDHAGYRQRLQEQIMGLIASGIEASVIDRPGGIFVRPAEQISSEDRILLQSVARAIITDGRGTLAEQLDHRAFVEPRVPRSGDADASVSSRNVAGAVLPGRDLILFNGLGGFTPTAANTSSRWRPARRRRRRGSNVLANPHFGTVFRKAAWPTPGAKTPTNSA
jgi:cyclic beta-1,2-glucan synthetase